MNTDIINHTQNTTMKKMSTLQTRLKIAMEGPPKIRAVDLAKSCGVSAPAVSEWLSGATKKLAGDNLMRAARYLDVSPDWLASGKGPMRPQRKSQAGNSEISSLYGFNRNAVPIVKISQINRLRLETSTGTFDINKYEKAYTTLEINEETFAFIASGDIMTSDIFREGSTIIAQYGMAHKEGDYVIAEENGSMIFAQYTSYGQDSYLTPINPRYPVKPITNNVKIIAVCLEVIRTLR